MTLPGYDEAALHREFDAEDGSFLLKLRCELEWDREAFDQLVGLMEGCAATFAGRETLPTWIAGGFWYIQWFVPDWSQHPNFPRPHGKDYYERAYRRLWDLAFWMFQGEHPGVKGKPLGAV